ncbi:unnamed protein product [Closterium sp. Naga37s-1]|nr:unnamed protein product [Closterium sp. Naga37s-1]
MATTEGLRRDHGEGRSGSSAATWSAYGAAAAPPPAATNSTPATGGTNGRWRREPGAGAETAGRGSEVEAQRQAVDSRGAQPEEEPRGLARRASNCSGSAPPSTLPAEDPPSSQAGGTPHPRRERGDPSNPPDFRVEQASVTAAGSAAENHAGNETTCAPGGARGNEGAMGDGQVTEGATADMPGPSASQQARTDPLPRAQPTDPVRQWWRTPPSVMKKRPEQARRGQKHAVQ